MILTPVPDQNYPWDPVGTTLPSPYASYFLAGITAAATTGMTAKTPMAASLA